MGFFDWPKLFWRPPCDLLLDVAQPPIAIAASKGLPVFSTPKHSTKSWRIAATTICLGLRRPRDFNRDTSATIAELYRMADRAGIYSAARRTALPILEMRVARRTELGSGRSVGTTSLSRIFLA